MTYKIQEEGVATGAPVELYKFTTDTESWYYTSCDETVTHLGDNYAPIAIKRSSPEIAGTTGESNLKVEVQRNNEIAARFRVTIPPSLLHLTLYRLHRSESGTPEGIVFWRGTVRSVTWQGDVASMHCELNTQLRREAPTRLYQKLCPHILYGAECGVAEASFSATGTVSAVANSTLITTAAASTQANGYWVPGFIKIGDELRTIIAHSGATVTVFVPFEDANVSDSLTLYAGCNHSKSICSSRFNNVLNYGGMPYIPTKNPFDSGVEG